MTEQQFFVDGDVEARLLKLSDFGRMCEQASGGGLPDPAAGSDLAVDDVAYPFEKLSNWTWAFFDSAADHMALWGTLTRPQGKPIRLHERASYTVLRGGLEAAAQAVWVLAPDNSADRIVRHLRLIHADFLEQRKVQRLAEEPTDLPEITAGERLASLKERSADIAPWPTIANTPSYLDMIREACPAADLDPWSAEVLWRGASGFAHGKQWARLAFAQVIPGEEYEPNQYRIQIRLSPTILVTMAEAAASMTDAALGLYVRRAGVRL
jgi:hypothetical protein